MFNLNTFFDGMSKSLLRAAHAKAFGHKGLLNNALIQSEVLSFYTNKERVKDLFSKMEPWQRRCLNLVYHSGSRGLTYNELRLTIPVSKNRELQSFLLNMCREYVMWRSSSANAAVYYGFADFMGSFVEFNEVELNHKTGFVSYQNLMDWHLCLVLSYAMRKELKINSNGTIHRRSYQICTDAIVAAKQVSERAAEHEVSIIFNFLIANAWLELEDSYLVPSEKSLDYIRKNGFRLHQDILTWWLKERFRNDRSHCAQLLSELAHPKSVVDASYLLWVLDPTARLQEKSSSIVWDYLPRPLRELWLLGLVDFQMDHGKVAAVALSQSGSEWVSKAIASIPDQNISCLPNYELIASTGTSPRVLFALACLAKVENDEMYLRFTLDKDSYVRGLKCALPESEIEHFKTWIKPPENVASSIEEWNASYYGAKVQTVRLLKIEDGKVLADLSRFPQFMELTEEFIPGYGFILKPELENRAFEILESFGYCPYVERKANNRQAAPSEEWRKDFVSVWPESKSADYDLKDEADENTLQTALNSTKYSSNYQRLATFDLVKVLRYAKTVNALVGAKVKDPNKRGAKETEMAFVVHALKLAKSPQTLEIQVQGKDEKESLDLSFIQEIKVIGNK